MEHYLGKGIVPAELGEVRLEGRDVEQLPFGNALEIQIRNVLIFYKSVPFC